MNDTLNPNGGLTSVALLELAAELLAIVVNGCKPVPVLEVTVAHGITLQKSVGATVRLNRKPNQEEKEEEGDHPQEGVQLDLRVQHEVRRVDPLVVVGLEILMVQRGRAEEEATLAERLQDPLQEVAQRAPLTLALCARIIFWGSVNRNRMNAPSGTLHHVGSSRREIAKKGRDCQYLQPKAANQQAKQGSRESSGSSRKGAKKEKKEKARSLRQPKRSLQGWPLCCLP